MRRGISMARGHSANAARGWPRAIGRLMRAHDLNSRKRRKFRIVTTDSKHAHLVAPNVLERNFVAEAPDQKSLADLTYVPTDEGWLYVALVLDLFARLLLPPLRTRVDRYVSRIRFDDIQRRNSMWLA